MLIFSTAPPLTMDRHRSGVVEGISTRLSPRPSPSAVLEAVVRRPISPAPTRRRLRQARNAPRSLANSGSSTNPRTSVVLTTPSRKVENLSRLYPIEVAQVGSILDRTIS
jgi:hypothetical protein